MVASSLLAMCVGQVLKIMNKFQKSVQMNYPE